jgi:Histidine kinase-, DNA gyrase B-, and HSP90-like ATPase
MEERLLKIRFAGRLIDLLGQQMYGGAVPSVAELVANAWDADAKKIEIIIPQNVQDPGAEIVVQDYGLGMTFDELNKYYLHVGYERRKSGETTPSGRLVMGRKGIGKLAGFGIAEDIIVTSVKDGQLVELIMNYAELRGLETTTDYVLPTLRDEPTDEPSGVKVTFKGLKLSRNINFDNFRTSMARRFALGSDEMEIIVNNSSITKENLLLDYRIPENGWLEDEVKGFGKIKYWFGFLKDTIKDSELRGVSVFARERVAQFTPFFFNLSGGINGQVALEYLTGQVKADLLDDKVDYIATDRQAVNWQFGNAPYLEEWGKNKIKELCSGWKKRHDKKNIDRFKHNLGDFYERINKLSSTTEKKDLTTALTKIASIERINEFDFKIIANSMVSGVERESVKKVIRRINIVKEDALPELYEAIKEWDIISAVSTAEIVFGRMEIIDQFKKHIDNRLPEKTSKGNVDMQTFIKEYPWLLGHRYEQLKPADLQHERGLDKWIHEVLTETNKEYSESDKKDGRRFDLLCIKNDWLIVILELMRPGLHEDYDHVIRLNRYVTRIKASINENKANLDYKGKSVFGMLIADHPSKDSSLGETKIAFMQNLESITWAGLFTSVQSNYREYYDLLKNKAPEDPRLQGLVNLGK